jgi:cytochrome b6-f complex iron-sulfur subunit
MENTNLSRGQFLKQLGLSSGALMAFYCLGTVTACTKDDEPAASGTTTNPNTTGTNTTTTKVDFTLDLTTNDYKKLKTEGEFVYKDDIIIANVKGGKFVALSKACTHAGTTVQYRAKEDDFWCSNHGSEFGHDGKVEKSPATTGLKVFKTELTGDKLRISE